MCYRIAHKSASGFDEGLSKRRRSKHTHAELMYCQSNETDRKPRPSLPSAPPNRLVKMSTVFWGALWDAKQKILNPFRKGKIYEGTISHMNIPVNASQNSFNRLLLLPIASKCRAGQIADQRSSNSIDIEGPHWNTVTVGRFYVTIQRIII